MTQLSWKRCKDSTTNKEPAQSIEYLIVENKVIGLPVCDIDTDIVEIWWVLDLVCDCYFDASINVTLCILFNLNSV